MKIIIKSRAEIEEMKFVPNTAVISISDANYPYVKFQQNPDYLLRLAFDDVDNDIFVDTIGRKPTEQERIEIETKYNMLSDSQAKEIVNFYNGIIDKAEILICQCEHGQSRSAAVAAAILEHRCRSGIQVFANDKYYPNKAVFNKVYKQLKGE